jgi:NAD(P)-dependent dehydrogenase (short-subunit alcohol dehydrogenase family)
LEAGWLKELCCGDRKHIRLPETIGATNLRCNGISPARVHPPFVEDYLRKTYPGREQEMFEAPSKAQPVGRMGEPEEVAALALFLCSDEASSSQGWIIRWIAASSICEADLQTNRKG